MGRFTLLFAIACTLLTAALIGGALLLGRDMPTDVVVAVVAPDISGPAPSMRLIDVNRRVGVATQVQLPSASHLERAIFYGDDGHMLVYAVGTNPAYSINLFNPWTGAVNTVYSTSTDDSLALMGQRYRLSFAPGARRFAFLDPAQLSTYIYDLDAARLTQLTPEVPANTIHLHLAWSPDAHLLALVDEMSRQVYLYDTINESSVTLSIDDWQPSASNTLPPMLTPHWLTDNGGLLLIGQDRYRFTLHHVDATTLAVTPIMPAFDALRIHVDTDCAPGYVTAIVEAGDRMQAQLVQLDTGETTPIEPFALRPNESIDAAYLSTDCRHVVVRKFPFSGTMTPDVYATDITTGEMRLIAQDAGVWATPPGAIVYVKPERTLYRAALDGATPPQVMGQFPRNMLVAQAIWLDERRFIAPNMPDNRLVLAELDSDNKHMLIPSGDRVIDFVLIRQ